MSTIIFNLQADDQLIVAAPMEELLRFDFGDPLHSLVIAGNVHVTEEEMLDCYRPQNLPGLKPYVRNVEDVSEEEL
jgi:diphthine synthase